MRNYYLPKMFTITDQLQIFFYYDNLCILVLFFKKILNIKLKTYYPLRIFKNVNNNTLSSKACFQYFAIYIVLKYIYHGNNYYEIMHLIYTLIIIQNDTLFIYFPHNPSSTKSLIITLICHSKLCI